MVGGGGCHWTYKFMGHIESKIKNLKGILREFSPYFLPARLPYLGKRHTLYTIYVFDYIGEVHITVFLI